MDVLFSKGTTIVEKAECVVGLKPEGRDYEFSFTPEFEISMKYPNEVVK